MGIGVGPRRRPDRTAYKKVALRQAGQRPYDRAGNQQPEAGCKVSIAQPDSISKASDRPSTPVRCVVTLRELTMEPLFPR